MYRTVYVFASKITARSIVLPASRFGSMFRVMPTPGADLYKELPLSTLCPKQRGEALSTIARNVVSDIHIDESFSDAIRGPRVDGSPRGPGQTEYDWCWGKLRVECKSSQLHWCRKRKVWFFRFANVKLAGGEKQSAVFDVLLLVFYTPRGIYIYEHDFVLGVSTSGRATHFSGHTIVILGEAGQDWNAALERVLARLDEPSNTCKHIAELSLQDGRVQSAEAYHSSSIMSKAFEGVPLSEMSPPSRGVLLQNVARQIDCLSHPGASIDAPDIGICINGQKRSSWTAPYDWTRDGLRVECKSAQLLWEKTNARWKVNFSHIKLDSNAFDELIIVLYTPSGVYIYSHDYALGVAKSGARSFCGQAVAIGGRCNEYDWRNGLDTILKKLDSSTCQRLAYIYWD